MATHQYGVLGFLSLQTPATAIPGVPYQGKRQLTTAQQHDQLAPFLKAHGETFMAMVDLEETIKASRWRFVVTNRALYKFEPGQRMDTPRKRKELLDVHSVERDTSDPNCFSVYMYKSKTKLQLSKMWGAIGLGMQFTSFLQRRHYVCRSRTERDQWVYLLGRLSRNCWQRALEATVIPAPEVYQSHWFAIKIRKGRAQDRILAISTLWIYNLEVSHNPTVIEPKSVKWGLPVAAVHTVGLLGRRKIVLEFDTSLARKLLDDRHLGSKGHSINRRHVFMLRTSGTRNRLVNEIKRVHRLVAPERELAVNQSGARNLSIFDGSAQHVYPDATDSVFEADEDEEEEEEEEDDDDDSRTVLSIMEAVEEEDEEEDQKNTTPPQTPPPDEPPPGPPTRSSPSSSSSSSVPPPPAPSSPSSSSVPPPPRPAGRESTSTPPPPPQPSARSSSPAPPPPVSQDATAPGLDLPPPPPSSSSSSAPQLDDVPPPPGADTTTDAPPPPPPAASSSGADVFSPYTNPEHRAMLVESKRLELMLNPYDDDDGGSDGSDSSSSDEDDDDVAPPPPPPMDIDVDA